MSNKHNKGVQMGKWHVMLALESAGKGHVATIFLIHSTRYTWYEQSEGLKNNSLSCPMALPPL